MKKSVFCNLRFMPYLQIRTKSYQQNENLRTLASSVTKQLDSKKHHRSNESFSSDGTIIADDLLSFAERRKQQNGNFLSSQGEILYGLHPVYCALKNQRRKFFHLYVKEENFAKRNAFAKTELRNEIMHLAASLGIKTTATNSHSLKVLSRGAVHQGVCLDVSSYPLLEFCGYDLDYTEASNKKPPLWLLLSEIQDPMNVGAILRSAYYFGVDKIFILPHSGCHLSPVVSKASSGALELLTVFLLQDLICFLEKRKNCGWHIVATAPVPNQDEECNVINLTDFHLTKPTVVILGNESKGVPPEVQPMCDYLVSIIPEVTHSLVDSLNVSVATGIMLHHLLCIGRS